jgi:lipopolysaccharide/colanic/teichoic acid biosynthesis glycosyltransferase
MSLVKRAIDTLTSAAGLVVLSPILGGLALAIWLFDRHSPIYAAERVARGGGVFRMVKLRSMTLDADRTKVDSTSAVDPRITPVGRIVRRYKLDELLQLWNVLTGDMSLVGPRPQVKREADLYTDVERRLFSVQPGITDLSSIVFSDEGEILAGQPDPDVAYNQLIRPWKSRLGLLYVEHQSVRLDFELVILTLVALVSRPRALLGVQRILSRLGADDLTTKTARRDAALTPYPPPGATAVVTHR